VPWRSNLSVVRWDVESSLREYLTHYLVFQANADRLLGNLALKALVAAAPGLSELTLLGKLTAPLRLRWYRRDVDLVVVDAYSTGQFMAFLRAPRGLSDSAASGLMHPQTRAIVELLSDPAICAYRLVTLAEEMPVSEACEMAADIRAETTIAPTIYCNRLLTLPPTLPAAAKGDATAPFVAHMRQIAQRQARALARLDALGDDKAGAVLRLPLVPTDDAAALVDALAAALSAAAA
jgi:anion-transporting  ArsA/GET3 family ATPase